MFIHHKYDTHTHHFNCISDITVRGITRPSTLGGQKRKLSPNFPHFCSQFDEPPTWYKALAMPLITVTVKLNTLSKAMI